MNWPSSLAINKDDNTLILGTNGKVIIADINEKSSPIKIAEIDANVDAVGTCKDNLGVEYAFYSFEEFHILNI